MSEINSKKLSKICTLEYYLQSKGPDKFRILNLKILRIKTLELFIKDSFQSEIDPVSIFARHENGK